MLAIRQRHLRRARNRTLLAAALEYVERGWPVAAGAHLVGDFVAGFPPAVPRQRDGRQHGRHRASAPRCSCGRPDCRRPGAHSAGDRLVSTTSPDIVAGWWSGPECPALLLVTGVAFDGWAVPAEVGERAARSGDGPVLVDPAGRWVFLSTRAVPAPRYPAGLQLDHLEYLEYLGPGGHLAAPPTVGLAGPAAWVRRASRLPAPAAVWGLLTTAA
jgi:hypothetical protein